MTRFDIKLYKVLTYIQDNAHHKHTKVSNLDGVSEGPYSCGPEAHALLSGHYPQPGVTIF